MTRSKVMIVGSSMLAVGVLLLCALPMSAQDNNTYINHATRFGISPPLRDLAKLPQSPHYGFHEANPEMCIRDRPTMSRISSEKYPALA